MNPFFVAMRRYGWQVVKSLSLDGNITLVAGESNTRMDTQFGLTNTITDDIALKLVHTRQKHSRVPEGLEDTDSVFSANLLFIF